MFTDLQVCHVTNPNDSKIDPWLSKLSINDAPVRRQGIATSLTFFAQHYVGITAKAAFEYLACMDLSKSVQVRRLRPGDIVVAYRYFAADPVRKFYTLKGYSPHTLGVNLDSKVKRIFQVQTSTPCLESTTSSTIDRWTRVAPGQDFRRLLDAEKRNEQTLNKGVREGKLLKDIRLENEKGVVVHGGGLQLLVPQAYASQNLACKNPPW